MSRLLPKDEIGWVGYFDAKDNLRYIIASKANSRDVYFLYEVMDGKLKKLGKSDFSL